MPEVSSHIPIKESDLLPFSKKAEADLKEVDWRPKKTGYTRIF
jgi:hypothetical protein